MTLKTNSDWQLFIQQQKESPFSILEFCQQHKISVSCFYKHKAQLKNLDKKPSSFIKVKSAVTPSQQPLSNIIKIQYGQTRLHLPSSIQPLWLAELLKALA
jgi:hypothetical protein